MSLGIAWSLALGLVAAGFAIAWWRSRSRLARLRVALRASSENLEHLQLAFERFAPGEIVEQIISTGKASHAERKEVTVLFADLVGFTALSERTDPDVLVRILNGYFEHMSRAITEHRGHISTLIGDGILALFGALEPNPWQGSDAVRAALAMREALERYNDDLEREGLPRLELGMGLHRGSGVAALVGSRDLMQFTFVGRIVNLAARIQQMTRGIDTDILVTQALRETLDHRFELRELPAVEARGIAEPVVIYAVDSFNDA
jgi:class 3 adenylate cyclase